MNKIALKKGSERNLKFGRQWIFSNELVNVTKYDTGIIVEVIDYNGFNYGNAFFNPKSLISLRMLNCNDFDSNVLKERILNAYNLRKILLPDEETFRLCYGESDFLPGLIIDKYGDYLSIQILSAGMDNLRNEIVQSLTELFPSVKGIIEKSSSIWRINEGLSDFEEIIYGKIPDSFTVKENDILLSLSLEKSQKTGYFLDQKLNRKKLRDFSKDKKVIDFFCNQGGFALNAAFAGAKEVIGVDSSKDAIEKANKNADLNNFSNTNFVQADVFDYLEKAIESNDKFDIVILDPPAFAKNKKSIPTAIKGYQKLNRLGIKIINQNGLLVSSSCSHHISEEMFLNLISEAAAKENKQLQLIYRGSQAPDHPILASMPETNYLKYLIFKVI